MADLKGTYSTFRKPPAEWLEATGPRVSSQKWPFLSLAFLPSNYKLTRFQFTFWNFHYRGLKRTPTEAVKDPPLGPLKTDPNKQGAPAADERGPGPKQPPLWALPGHGPQHSKGWQRTEPVMSRMGTQPLPSGAFCFWDCARDFLEEAATALALSLTQSFVCSECFRLH